MITTSLVAVAFAVLAARAHAQVQRCLIGIDIIYCSIHCRAIYPSKTTTHFSIHNPTSCRCCISDGWNSQLYKSLLGYILLLLVEESVACKHDLSDVWLSSSFQPKPHMTSKVKVAGAIMSSPIHSKSEIFVEPWVATNPPCDGLSKRFLAWNVGSVLVGVDVSKNRLWRKKQ